MDLKPKISVIVPIYNVKEYMDRCLTSLVNQTVQEIEIILIDDGSTDGSSAKCDIWSSKDKRIRVLHKKNEGVSKARNEGILLAKGEWISFVDADDWLEPNTYKIALSKGINCDMVIWNFRDYDGINSICKKFTEGSCVINSKKDLEKIKKYNFVGEKKDGSAFNMGMLNVWNKMIKKDILAVNKIRFNNDLKNYEDFLFSLILYEYVSSIAFIDMPLYVRYIRPGSASRALNKNIYENNKIATQCMEEWLHSFHLCDEWYKNGVKQYYVGWFMEILLKNYFHPTNEESFVCGYKKTKKLLLEEPYKSAFDYKLMHTSYKKKLICFLGKRKLALILCLLCKIK